MELSRIAARSSCARGLGVGLALPVGDIPPLEGDKSRGRFALEGVKESGAE
jgi:hypothetical protein